MFCTTVRKMFNALRRVSSGIPTVWSRAMSTDIKRVGFIGLGNMGAHMSHNLVKQGYEVSVYDLNADAVSRLETAGAIPAANPGAAADGADVIITMLPNTSHVEETLTGENGVFDAMKKGAFIIDSSTIDPNAVKRLAKLAAEHSASFLDAPVSGGVPGAEAGTLTFMVGGGDDALKTTRPVFEAMGKNIVHCGPTGMGQATKLCNNLVLGISMIGVAEAIHLGQSLGMDPKRLSEVFNSSTARCWSSDTYNPCPGVMEGVPASREYSGGFGVSLMHKDLGLALDAAAATGSKTPLGNHARDTYEKLMKDNMGGKDFGSVYEWIKNNSGKTK